MAQIYFKKHGCGEQRHGAKILGSLERVVMYLGRDIIVSHFLLVLGWILFGILHSLLASVPVKKKLYGLLGRQFIYYRLFYSFFALSTLVPLLVVQFSMNSMVVWETPRYLKTLFMFGLSVGLVTMVITCSDYFTQLSGIQAFKKSRSADILIQNGLHRFVRHPLYAGTIAFAWSLLFFFPLLNHLLACCMLTIYTLIGIKLEERKLLIKFGAAYKQYQEKVPMLIPFIKWPGFYWAK